MEEEKVTQPETVADVEAVAEEVAAEEVAQAAAPAPEMQEAQARIAELEKTIAELGKTIADLQRSARRREAEILLSRTLRERGLRESFTALLLTDSEVTLTEAEAHERVALIEDAVRAEAENMFRAQIQPTRPQVGDPNPHPLSPEVIRSLPLARLAEAMRNN